jgi:hypothetical protein
LRRHLQLEIVDGVGECTRRLGLRRYRGFVKITRKGELSGRRLAFTATLVFRRRCIAGDRHDIYCIEINRKMLKCAQYGVDSIYLARLVAEELDKK